MKIFKTDKKVKTLDKIVINYFYFLKNLCLSKQSISKIISTYKIWHHLKGDDMNDNFFRGVKKLFSYNFPIFSYYFPVIFPYFPIFSYIFLKI